MSSPAIAITTEQARRLLVRHHFEPGTVVQILERLRTIQFDPLNPVGRNPDLVLQARVPGYQFDDWQHIAYQRREMYDAWDKQACLVPMEDWSRRAIARSLYPPWHDPEILQSFPGMVDETLAEIDRRGPLSSLEFADRTRVTEGEMSWYGPTRIKRILRALWADGRLVTHHRQGARHYYDRPERVIPQPYFEAGGFSDPDDYRAWILLQRHRSVGLLRPRSDASIHSACGDAGQRARALRVLLTEGSLVPIRVGERETLYHMPTELVRHLDATALDSRIRFLAPLDSLLWDRGAIREIFGFDYLWEVYKPERLRKWGYYVLPVLFGDRFVGRFESRLQAGTWTILRWWWEPEAVPNANMIGELRLAGLRFFAYLRARAVDATSIQDRQVRAVFEAASRST